MQKKEGQKTTPEQKMNGIVERRRKRRRQAEEITPSPKKKETNTHGLSSSLVPHSHTPDVAASWFFHIAAITHELSLSISLSLSLSSPQFARLRRLDYLSSAQEKKRRKVRLQKQVTCVTKPPRFVFFCTGNIPVPRNFPPQSPLHPSKSPPQTTVPLPLPPSPSTHSLG